MFLKTGVNLPVTTNIGKKPKPLPIEILAYIIIAIVSVSVLVLILSFLAAMIYMCWWLIAFAAESMP